MILALVYTSTVLGVYRHKTFVEILVPSLRGHDPSSGSHEKASEKTCHHLHVLQAMHDYYKGPQGAGKFVILTMFLCGKDRQVTRSTLQIIELQVRVLLSCIKRKFSISLKRFVIDLLIIYSLFYRTDIYKSFRRR